MARHGPAPARSPASRLTLGLLLTLNACAAGREPTRPSSSAGPAGVVTSTVATSSVADDPELRLERHLDTILGAAAREAPSTLALLSGLVEDSPSWLHKLEHRLKTRDSLRRKLRLIASERPTAEVEGLTVGDALRFMMVTPDVPPGAYLEQARRSLHALASAGHRVLRVKNYWRRGDDYSGINCDLLTPSGFPWELQFQTPESLETNAQTRAQYEELRAKETSKAKKRLIFEAMTEAWREVPIPAGVLEPGAIHPKEELLDRAPPAND